MILMVLAMVSHIIFPANDRRPEINIKRINSCRIESGWESLTDTAVLKIPRRFIMKDARKSRLQDILKRGDEIVIKLGYGKELNEEFRGYISELIQGEPVEIHCEDEMWKLKQKTVNKAYKAVKLEKLLKDVAGEYTIDAIDVDLGDIHFEKVTVAQVLQAIKDKYRIYTYFKTDKKWKAYPGEW